MIRPTLALIALTTAAQADGLALSLMPVDPCWRDVFTPAIVEADTDAQRNRYAGLCGAIPKPALAYVPGHPTRFYRVPPPLPSPVPLGGSAGYLIAAMAVMALGGRKMAILKRLGVRISNQKPPYELRPGRPAAVKLGCTCKQGQKGQAFRDGTGWDISPDCPCHSHWGELAE